jgi:hypothetical protein
MIEHIPVSGHNCIVSFDIVLSLFHLHPMNRVLSLATLKKQRSAVERRIAEARRRRKG